VITARGGGGAGPDVVPGFIVKALPYLTVVIAAFAPLAAAVYLVVSAGWSVAERWVFASRQPQRGSGAQSTGARPGASPTLRDRAHRP